MAGINIKFRDIYKDHTITDMFQNMGFTMMSSVTPIIFVAGALFLMLRWLEPGSDSYTERELLASTILYVFIFSVCINSPLSALNARYLADIVYREEYDEVLPCYYMNMLTIALATAILAIPFYIRVYIVGQVPIQYLVLSYFMLMALVLVFYNITFLYASKDYKQVSLFFFIGMLFTVTLAYLLHKFTPLSIGYVVLFCFAMGFALIAMLEYIYIASYHRKNSHNYTRVFGYLKGNWKYFLTNAFYSVGLFVHNFVFWGSDLQVVVADSYVSARVYDMATCLAMFTNISAMAIFTVKTEMNFHERYKAHSEAVLAGKLRDIRDSQNRMFRMMKYVLDIIVQLQFVISITIFLIIMVLSSRLGFAGQTISIYPCLAAGYFILYLMYCEIMFLLFLTDDKGAMITAVLFFFVTLFGSLLAREFFTIEWYGMGVVLGSFVGWTFAFFRLRKLEARYDLQIFCKGEITKIVRSSVPNPVVPKSSYRINKAANKGV